MLFLLKRTWPSALAALIVLTLLALSLRQLLPAPVPIEFTLLAVCDGLVVFALLGFSDALIHAALWLLGPSGYRTRYDELIYVFDGQSLAAMLTGAVMAGLGEELIFRGLSREPVYLGLSAIMFGLFHHIGRTLWPFTLWSIWQAVLLAIALSWSGNLAVTMTAHFLHDLVGFLYFGFLRRRGLRNQSRTPRAGG